MKRESQIIEIMENSIHLINEQYNQPLHLNIIAKQNFMSPATYSRYFFELTQCSFSDYVNKLRVNHAKKDSDIYRRFLNPYCSGTRFFKQLRIQQNFSPLY